MLKDFGFSVLVFIAVCEVFVFCRKYERFFGFVIQCAFWVFLFYPIWVPVSLRFERQLISNRVLFIYLFIYLFVCNLSAI